VTACTLQGMARVRSGQAPAWPLVSDRSVRRGSRVKRDFACAFTRRYSPVLVALRSQSRLRLEGRTRTLSGPSPDLSQAMTLAPSGRSENLLIRRFPCGYPRSFRSVRDLGGAPLGCPKESGEPGSRSSVWLPVWLPAGTNMPTPWCSSSRGHPVRTVSSRAPVRRAVAVIWLPAVYCWLGWRRRRIIRVWIL